MIKTAVLSEDGLYRYELTRVWDEDQPRLGWIMLNPSTADAKVDDPTIRRCINFAKRDGFGGITVCNLFAFRATNPDELRTPAWGYNEIIGPENGAYLQTLLVTHETVVAAWGAWWDSQPLAVRPPRLSVERWGQLMCLGTTKSGAPRHPLYVRGDTPLVEFA